MKPTNSQNVSMKTPELAILTNLVHLYEAQLTSMVFHSLKMYVSFLFM